MYKILAIISAVLFVIVCYFVLTGVLHLAASILGLLIVIALILAVFETFGHFEVIGIVIGAILLYLILDFWIF